MDYDSDQSDVSLTSTTPSEAKSEYPVDRILAEELDGGVHRYLILWEGYPIERYYNMSSNKQTMH